MSQKNHNVTGGTTSEDNLIVKREELEAEIIRLAQYDKRDYALCRQSTADKFGIKVTALDEFVNDEIQKHQPHKDCNPGQTIALSQIVPWPEKIDPANLLSELTRTIEKYVVIGEHEATATALWIVFTHCFDGASISPLLYICSPEKRCGKTTLLSLIHSLVCRPLPAANITAAATFRVIETYKPTLLLDEVDTFINDKSSELAGVINSGHTPSLAFSLRVVGEKQEVKAFSTWCPKCLAGIGGSMPDTTKDRSIFIKLRPKLKNEKIEKLRRVNKSEILDLQRKCARFAIDNTDVYKTVPAIPIELNDRASDSWEHLFQIASVAGDDWLKKATDAALAISGVDVEHENKSLGIELLEDIQNIFDGKYKNAMNITTAELIEALCADDESPWATFNKYGKDPKITARHLSTKLKPYGISSINLNRGRERPKGYLKSAFKDAFSRYIPSHTPDFSATTATTVTQMAQTYGLQGENEEKIHPLPISYDASTAATSGTNIQTNCSGDRDMVANSSGCEKSAADCAMPGLHGKSSSSSDKNKEDVACMPSHEIVENTAEGFIEI